MRSISTPPGCGFRTTICTTCSKPAATSSTRSTDLFGLHQSAAEKEAVAILAGTGQSFGFGHALERAKFDIVSVLEFLVQRAAARIADFLHQITFVLPTQD